MMIKIMLTDKRFEILFRCYKFINIYMYQRPIPISLFQTNMILKLNIIIIGRDGHFRISNP